MNPWNMLLGLSLALPSLATAQTWTLQASDPTAVPLKGVFTVSLDEAWAIGEQGVLVHTEDAGRTWSKTILSPPVGMSNVTFVDPQHGWAVGNAVFRTTDGGATWQRVSFTHGTLGAVFFLDRFVGWTCDRWNVFRTKDGGITWEALPRPSARGASSFFFFDLQNGWLVTPWGDIEKTADGGQTWTVVETVGDLLSHVWFLDATEGWAVGGNTAMHTGDGGASWQRRSFPSTERVGSATFVAPSVPGGDPVSYAAGVGGCVVKSLDGWRTYSVVRPVGSGPLLWHVQFADADHGFVVGDYGVLLYTNDGGANWYSRQSGGPGGFHRMDANDPAHAWLAADLGNVFFTTDGGIRWRWTLVAGFSQYGTIQSVDFLDDNLTGWATGVEQAWGGNTSRISRSLDGGRTWQLQFTSPIDFFFETIDALDEETAVASGWRPRAGALWVRTSDGGRTWRDITPPATVGVMYDSDFVDARVGYIGGGRIWKTVDAGQSWTELPLPDQVIEGISFADAQNGWGLGGYGYVIHTSDGGATWDQQAQGLWPNYRMLGVSAVSPTEAWLVGDESFSPWRRLVARTRDGGATWQEENVVGTGTLLQAVAFLDRDYGWIAGGISTGWQYFDGGIWQRRSGPPPGLALLHDRLLVGRKARLQVTGATPLDFAAFFLSPTGIGSGAGLDLLPPVHLLGVRPVGTDGSAVLRSWLPPGLPTVEVHFQALVMQPAGTGTPGGIAAIAKTNTTSGLIEP